MKKYVFNKETLKIELRFEKAEYLDLSAELKSKLKSSFLWSKSGGCWVSRAKEPNLGWAKRVAEELGFEDGGAVGERLSFAEQLERKQERAEARAERYQEYAANAEARAAALQKPINDLHGDIAFFTQPNVNTSGGRAFTNYREKLYSRYDKGFEEYRKSDYFQDKAATALQTAAGEKYNDKGYLDRQIKACKKTIAAKEGEIIRLEDKLYRVEQGEELKTYHGEVITADALKNAISEVLELVEAEMDKQAYLENLLEELGGVQFNRDNIKPGYIVKIARNTIGEVVSCGPLNFKYTTVHNLYLTASYAEIVEVIKAVEKPKETHPFKVGQTFEVRRVDKRRSFADKAPVETFEIIKATEKSITLKNLSALGEKPITRKPSKRCGEDKWYWAYDDSYGNLFFMAAEEKE